MRPLCLSSKSRASVSNSSPAEQMGESRRHVGSTHAPSSTSAATSAVAVLSDTANSADAASQSNSSSEYSPCSSSCGADDGPGPSCGGLLPPGGMLPVLGPSCERTHCKSTRTASCSGHERHDKHPVSPLLLVHPHSACDRCDGQKGQHGPSRR